MTNGTPGAPASLPLPPSSAVEAAIQALASQGRHGIVAALAREYGVSRSKIYDLRARAGRALASSFAPPEPEDRGSFTLRVRSADIARTIIALRVATPSSIRDEVALLPIIYGTGWSYGTIHGVLVEAEAKAARALAEVSLAKVNAVALDEMFSQQVPVFAGIDLDSGYLIALEVRPTRSGADWAEVLMELDREQDLRPVVVVKDAGSGLAAGVSAAWPKAEQRDDLFHVVYLLGKEAAHLERRAYGSIAAVETLWARSRRPQTPAQRESGRKGILIARADMDHCIERYDQFERLRQEAGRTLTLTERGRGELRAAGEVTTTLVRIGTEMATLGGKRVVKLAGYLQNRATGLGLYLAALRIRVDAAAESAGGAAATAAMIRAYQASLEVEQGGPAWDRTARRQEVTSATAALLDATGRDPERLQRVVAVIVPLLVARHRASSAIECLNSVLRPYLVVQKHAHQGFLNLFRFYWNTRTREWGRHKGTSAHEVLTGASVPDWLSFLGYPPGAPTTEN